MLDFSAYLDLPVIWGAILVTAIFLYVVLDGFSLGVGILFPFAPDDKARDLMMHTVAPFWDGNETWLVLGGGGLLAAFPMAFALIMPAIYMPLTFMLIALVFRGIAFEVRFKVELAWRAGWNIAFHLGSLVAAFMQGIILGAIVQGVKVKELKFVGGAFDWLSAFSIICGLGVVAGFVLLGAGWLILKTNNYLQKWAQRAASYILLYVLFFMLVLSAWTPFIQPLVFARWFSKFNYPLVFIPVGGALCVYLIWRGIKNNSNLQPFLGSILLFGVGLGGLLFGLWPYFLPMQLTVYDLAASSTAQSLMLVGVLLVLPVVLAYTAYSYYVFWGKVEELEPGY